MRKGRLPHPDKKINAYASIRNDRGLIGSEQHQLSVAWKEIVDNIDELFYFHPNMVGHYDPINRRNPYSSLGEQKDNAFSAKEHFEKFPHSNLFEIIRAEDLTFLALLGEYLVDIGQLGITYTSENLFEKLNVHKQPNPYLKPEYQFSQEAIIRCVLMGYLVMLIRTGSFSGIYFNDPILKDFLNASLRRRTVVASDANETKEVKVVEAATLSENSLSTKTCC